MSTLLLPGHTAGRHGDPMAQAVIIVALAIPMGVIVTVALVPALVACPFLLAERQRLVIKLLSSLGQWTLTLSRYDPDRP